MKSIIIKISTIGLALILGASQSIAESIPSSVSVNSQNVDRVMLYQEKLYDSRTYARAYVLEKVHVAETNLDRLKIKNPMIRRDYLMSAYDHAKGEVMAQEWSGGWTSIALKAGVAGGVAYGGSVIVTGGATLVPVLVAAGGSALAGVIDKKMKDYEKTPPTKYMNPDMVVTLNVWGDLIKESGDPALKEISIRSKEEIMGRSDAIPDFLDRDFIARKRNDQINQKQDEYKQSLDATSRTVKDLKNGMVTKKQYIEMKKELIRRFDTLATEAVLANKNLKKIGEYVDQQQDRERRAIERENISGPFSFGAGVAELFNDPKAAHMFNKAAQLSAALNDISGITMKMFKQQPWACANMYLAAATLTVELIKGAQKSEFEVTMEALQQISKQINELRIEMHARFDRLEQRMDYYFSVVLINLRDIVASQQLIAGTVERLHEDMSRLQRSLDNGIHDLAQMNLGEWEAECFGMKSNKNPLRFTNEKTANQCFSRYILLGSGYYSNALRLKSPEKDNTGDTDFDKYSFKNLAEQVYEHGGAAPKHIYSPTQFKYGANKTLQLLYRNPNYSSISSDPSFQQLIENGESLQKFEANMALESSGSNYKLRRPIFEALLSQYKKNVMDAWSAARDAVTGVRGVGPTPGKKWNEPIPEDMPELYQMLREPLAFCRGSKLEMGYYETTNYREHIDERKVRVYQYRLDKMLLTKKIFPLLPQSVVWANRMGSQALSARVHPCIRKAKIPAFYSKAYLLPLTTYELELELDLYVTYTYFNPKTRKDEEKTFLATKLSGKKRDVGLIYDPRWGAGTLEAAWTGIQQPDSPTRLMAVSKDVAGITNAPEQFFTNRVITDEMGADIEEFESHLANFFEVRQKEAIEKTRKNTVGPEKDVASILWQLSYLVRNGIHLSNPAASELYTLLISGYLPLVSQVTQWGIATGADGRSVSEMLDSRINSIREKLDEMETCGKLKPAPSSLYPYVFALKAFTGEEEKQCKYLPNFLCF